MEENDFSYKNYSDEYPKLFEQMKSRIFAGVKNKHIIIDHIGSTSVPGLGGKGIIDIQIGINKWSEADEIQRALKKLGFQHFHDIENYNLFASTKAKCAEGDFHIHICRKSTKRYKRTLRFRDYLRDNPMEAERYQELKKRLFDETGQNRQLFKELKNSYFENLAKGELWKN